jgi:hypothetical protein
MEDFCIMKLLPKKLLIIISRMMKIVLEILLPVSDVTVEAKNYYGWPQKTAFILSIPNLACWKEILNVAM